MTLALRSPVASGFPLLLLGAFLADAFSDLTTDAIFGTYPAAPALQPVAEAAARDLASVLPGAQPERTDRR